MPANQDTMATTSSLLSRDQGLLQAAVLGTSIAERVKQQVFEYQAQDAMRHAAIVWQAVQNTPQPTLGSELMTQLEKIGRDSAAQLSLPSPLLEPRQHKTDGRLILLPQYEKEVMSKWSNVPWSLQVGLQPMMTQMWKSAFAGTSFSEWRSGTFDQALLTDQRRPVAEIATEHLMAACHSFVRSSIEATKSLQELRATKDDRKGMGDRQRCRDKVAKDVKLSEDNRVAVGRIRQFLLDHELGQTSGQTARSAFDGEYHRAQYLLRAPLITLTCQD